MRRIHDKPERYLKTPTQIFSNSLFMSSSFNSNKEIAFLFYAGIVTLYSAFSAMEYKR